MQALSKPTRRPISVSLIALFQASLAAYLIYFVVLAYLDPPDKLGLLRSALRLLIGRTDPYSYAGRPHEEIVTDLFFLAVLAVAIAAYSAVTGLGLWRLKKWARHSVASEYGAMLAFWARSFLYFGVGGGFARVPATTLQPVYIVVAIEAMVCTTLLFYGGVAEAFGEVD